LSGAHSASHFGYYAVRAFFFVLSGILLTKSLHETYSFDFYRFYINRLLRILPLYALVCGTRSASFIGFRRRPPPS
jgi:peptidoglycan/LPS O-acetylase OafA/YrhL